MVVKNNERRRNARKVFTRTIEYVTRDEHGGINFMHKSLSGLTINVSDSGICIYARNPLQKGEELKIVKSAPPIGQRSATVKWVRKLNNELYKVGLMYTDQKDSDSGHAS